MKNNLIQVSEVNSYIQKVANLSDLLEAASYRTEDALDMTVEVTNRLSSEIEKVQQSRIALKEVIDDILRDELRILVKEVLSKTFTTELRKRLELDHQSAIDVMDDFHDKTQAIHGRLSRVEDLLVHRITQLEAEVARPR